MKMRVDSCVLAALDVLIRFCPLITQYFSPCLSCILVCLENDSEIVNLIVILVFLPAEYVDF